MLQIDLIRVLTIYFALNGLDWSTCILTYSIGFSVIKPNSFWFRSINGSETSYKTVLMWF